MRAHRGTETRNTRDPIREPLVCGQSDSFRMAVGPCRATARAGVHVSAATDLSHRQRRGVVALFQSALPGGAAVAATLLGAKRGAPYCFRRGRDVEAAVLRGYECAVLMAGARCTAAAIFRHVHQYQVGDGIVLGPRDIPIDELPVSHFLGSAPVESVFYS